MITGSSNLPPTSLVSSEAGEHFPKSHWQKSLKEDFFFKEDFEWSHLGHVPNPKPIIMSEDTESLGSRI